MSSTAVLSAVARIFLIVLVWLNGPFGVGKTTTAERLVSMRPGCRHYDAQSVGNMLQRNRAGVRIGDVEYLAPWRQLLAGVARHIVGLTGDELVMVQTVWGDDDRQKLVDGLNAASFSVLHVLLDIEPERLRARIGRDDAVQSGVEAGSAGRGGTEWRLNHVATFAAARSSMVAAADVVIDAGRLDVDQVAHAVLDSLPADWAAAHE